MSRIGKIHLKLLSIFPILAANYFTKIDLNVTNEGSFFSGPIVRWTSNELERFICNTGKKLNYQATLREQVVSDFTCVK